MNARMTRPLAVLLAAAGLVVAGCGDDSDSGSKSSTGTGTGTSAAQITAPKSVASAGKLVACSDMTLPPYIYVDEQDKPAGRDADLGRAIAKLMGVEAQFQQTGFDGIIAALKAKKCDMLLTDIYATDERRKQVDFVLYGRAGEALLVKKGNPKGIRDLPDMAGKRLAAIVGTTSEPFLADTSKQLESEGKEKIDITVLNSEPDAVNAVKAGTVDGVWLGADSAALYAKKAPDSFESWGDKQYNPSDVGIAVRKDDPELKTALTEAIDKLYADGSMKKIFTDAGLQATLIPGKS